ncbi:MULTISPECIES: hypothetical protein [Microcystis]|nr:MULTISPECIES: hypothetical protein [Microcystis]
MIQLSVNSKQLSVVSGNYELSIMNYELASGEVGRKKLPPADRLLSPE